MVKILLNLSNIHIYVCNYPMLSYVCNPMLHSKHSYNNYTFIYTLHTHKHTHTHAIYNRYMHIHTYTFYTCILTHSCIYTYIRTYVRTYIHTCMHTTVEQLKSVANFIVKFKIVTCLLDWQRFNEVIQKVISRNQTIMLIL